MSRDQQQGRELLQHHNTQWIIDWPTYKHRTTINGSINGCITLALFMFHKSWNRLLQSFGALNDTRLERAPVQGGPRIQLYHGGEKITFISRVEINPSYIPIYRVVITPFFQLLKAHLFVAQVHPSWTPWMPPPTNQPPKKYNITNPSYFFGGGNLNLHHQKFGVPQNLPNKNLGLNFGETHPAPQKQPNQPPQPTPLRKTGNGAPLRQRLWHASAEGHHPVENARLPGHLGWVRVFPWCFLGGLRAVDVLLRRIRHTIGVIYIYTYMPHMGSMGLM